MTRKYDIPLSFANFRFKIIFVRGKKLLFFHFDCVFAGIHLWAGRDQRCFALIKHTAFFGVGFVNRILFLLFWLIYFKHLNYSKWIPVFEEKSNTYEYNLVYRSEERRVGKECRSRWSP